VTAVYEAVCEKWWFRNDGLGKRGIWLE